jgi:hypothetical protein
MARALRKLFARFRMRILEWIDEAKRLGHDVPKPSRKAA